MSQSQDITGQANPKPEKLKAWTLPPTGDMDRGGGARDKMGSPSVGTAKLNLSEMPGRGHPKPACKEVKSLLNACPQKAQSQKTGFAPGGRLCFTVKHTTVLASPEPCVFKQEFTEGNPVTPNNAKKREVLSAQEKYTYITDCPGGQKP